MRKIIKSAIAIGAVSLLAACGGDKTTSNNAVPTNYHDIRTTLQGTIFNAIDGSRITTESLQVTLVQGSDYRSANLRKGTADFAGDYSIDNIPTSTNNSNINYRIVSTATGFQPFEASIAFNVATDSLQDNRANRIGNIYMYPLASFASDVKVKVTFNNEAVVGASVLLNPRTNNNVVTTDISNVLFSAASGFLGAQTVITDASGVATFAAANLVLGGQYSINVLPTTHEGSALALSTVTTTVVGTNNNINNITMTETVPGNENGLYVASASNLDPDMVTSGGALTLTFSRAVSLVDETAIGATLTNNTTAILDATSAPNSNVAGTLSADGLTLTLTPQFSTAPLAYSGTNGGTADNGLMVAYTNVFVRINDTTDSAVIYDVFALIAADTGIAQTNSVQATANF